MDGQDSAGSRTGGEVFVDVIVAYGIDTVFGIPGAQVYGLFDAFATAANFPCQRPFAEHLGVAELPQYLAATPRIVSTEVAQDDWSELGEMQVES